MSDLRKAAEMALEALENSANFIPVKTGLERETNNAIQALRQALAHEALDRMVAENQKLGLYDEDNLQAAIEKGTKAWADVPANWVEELRGNETPPCKTHPDAPHGFDRNASHSADRYVCECEGWEPVDWEAVASDQAMTIAMLKLEKRDNSTWVGLTDEQIYEHRWWHHDTSFAVNKELKDKNSAPYAKNDTSDRVLHKEWVGLTANEVYECWKFGDVVAAVEAKLKEKNT